jgi:hypothetical protein
MNVVRRLRFTVPVRIACVALLAAAGACTVGYNAVEGGSGRAAGGWVNTLGSNQAMAILTRFNWQQNESPLFTDDQQLHKSQTEFGQYAWIVPSPLLDTMSTFLSETDGVLVALLNVDKDDPANLPTTYQNLQLSKGLNCIYLKRVGSVASGYVLPAIDPAPAPPAPLCPAHYSNATPLTISVVKFAAFKETDIPAVARFHEGANAHLKMDNAPFFGMKCFDAWCQFLPNGVTAAATPQSSEGMGRVYAVTGFGDAQHVAMPADDAAAAAGPPPTTPRLLKSDNMSAWIVPDPNLGSWHKEDYLADYRHVATVKFANGPKSKYSSRWHFEPHTENHIYIKAVDIAANKWIGYVLRRTYFLGIPMPLIRRIKLDVTRDDHSGMTVPPTARFRWNPLDEDIWVMCDDGCCKVSDPT